MRRFPLSWWNRNCSATKKGAFTGANQKGSIGLIRKADKGTLFLDEIGDMPLPTQARLLRVLQERCVQPVGSSELFPVDLRIISATNRALARAGASRALSRGFADYRIGGLTLELPPLRERTDKQALFQQLWQQHREPTRMGRFECRGVGVIRAAPMAGEFAPGEQRVAGGAGHGRGATDTGGASAG